jgi:hypothetical protein
MDRRIRIGSHAVAIALANRRHAGIREVGGKLSACIETATPALRRCP